MRNSSLVSSAKLAFIHILINMKLSSPCYEDVFKEGQIHYDREVPAPTDLKPN